MNTRSIWMAAAVSLGCVMIWRRLKIADLVRKGWPKWMAEIEVDFAAWADCAEPEAWPT